MYMYWSIDKGQGCQYSERKIRRFVNVVASEQKGWGEGLGGDPYPKDADCWNIGL